MISSNEEETIKGKEKKVSIIIPCKSIDKYTRECISYCKELEYNEELYEIIVLPDANEDDNIEGVKVVPTGSLTPGAKRNIGMREAKGEILAFIDSDAYPRRDWLKNALKYLKGDVVAVGGPGVTPPNDTLMQKASGYVLSSFMAGSVSRRYRSRDPVYSDDIHSCNFVALRSIIEEVGGWNERYWPGEDTLLCLAITRRGKKMIEAPDVVVYHHRKPLFRKHLKQIARFGLHRGFFARKFGGNSRKIFYFMPSIMVLLLVIGLILSSINTIIRRLFIAGLLLYVALCFLSALMAIRSGKEKISPKLLLLVWLGIIMTHITYGVFFLAGLTRSELER